MYKLDNVTLQALAPPSITRDKNIQAIIKAIDPEIKSLHDSIKNLLIYARIDELPENIIDLLAWQWHVDFYELAQNLDAKRAMVKDSIEWHRHKGTSYAIIKALSMLGVEAKFIPWYEEIHTSPENIHDLSEFPPLSGNESLLTERVISRTEPYTFSIDAKLNNDFWERVDWSKPTQSIRKLITESKAARSYATRIYVHFEDYSQKKLFVAQVSPQGIFRRVNLSKQHERNLSQKIFVQDKNQTALSLRINTAQKNLREVQHKINTNDSLAAGKNFKVNNAQSRLQNLTQNIFTGSHDLLGELMKMNTSIKKSRSDAKHKRK